MSTFSKIVKRRAQALSSVAGLAMVALIVILVNVIGHWTSFRLDLTGPKAYSLSPASKKLVRDLNDPVIVKAYFTPDLPPPYNFYERYVRDLLSEYRATSRGKVRFEFVLATPAPDFQRKASEAGLMPIQFEQMDSDQFQVKQGFMGLVLYHRNKSEVLPIIRDVTQMEYDITSRIAKMADRTKKVIAVSVGHGESDFRTGQSKMVADLKDLYDFQDVHLSSPAAASFQADALLVLGPRQKFDDKALAAMDQAIGRGIPVAFLLDAKNLMLNQFYALPLDSGLGNFLQRYGISLGDRLVYDAQCETIGVTQNMAGMTFNTKLRYPFIPLVDSVMATHPIGRGLDTVGIPFTTTVEPLANLPAGIHFTPILYTSPKSWLTKPAAYMSVSPTNIPVPTADDPRGPFSIAGLIEGPQMQLFVLGTSHVLDAAMPGFPGDDAFVSNLLAFLSKDTTLLGIRAKGDIIRPLKPVSSTVKQLVKYGTVLGSTFLFIALGLLRWKFRQRRRELLAAQFAPRPA